MNKKLISLAIAGAVATPFAAQAGSFTVGNQDIKVSGGITGAYLYTSEDTSGGAARTKQDEFVVPDALVDFSSDAKTGGMGFTLGIGTLGENSLAPQSELTVIGGPNFIPTQVGVQYGWVSVKPMDNLTVDAGLLATNVGYEVSPSYGNANILRGLVWNAQPTYYTGARATYTMNGINIYAELNKDPLGLGTGNAGGAIGASGDFGGIHGVISYFDQTNNRSIVDIIASGKVGSVTVGANLDYITKAKATKVAGTDDNAFGLALYASVMPMDKVTLPVRIEYVDDGTSGLYGLGGAGLSNSAITFTVTPTYNFTDSTFVRAELAYVSTDKKSVYVDDKGAITDSAWTVGVQGGVLF